MEQTFISASYTFSLSYYFDRPGDDVDQSHSLDVRVDHKFTERHRLKLEDQFTYSREPTLVEPGTPVTAPTTLRTSVEGIRNLLPMEFDWQLTRLFALAIGYQNTYYYYFDSGDGSFSALLNRVENLFRVDARYQLREHSTALLGYQFGLIDYTSSDHLSTDPASLKASARDSQSHYVYAGYEQEFANHLSLSARAGGQFIDYPNLKSNNSDISPYADLSLTYQYLPGDNIRFGLKQTHTATDIVGDAASADTLVKDQDTTTVYLSVVHKFTPKMTANATAQYQHSTFNGGTLDGEADDYITVALLLAYKFTRNWSAEVEYDFDKLFSALPGREFDRNRVYGGVRFTF
jgi:hypothetical protein